MKDYYKILNISKDASESEIKSAFRKLALAHHPDKGGDQNKFNEISEAYEVLSDKEKRMHYDNGGDMNFADLHSHFNNFPDIINIQKHFQNFGFNFHTGFNKPEMNIKTVESTINITLNDCINGLNKTINFVVDEECLDCLNDCDNCDGTGQVQKIEQINQPGIPIGFCRRIIMPCNICEGKGKKIRAGTCNKCNNTHKIKLEEKLQFYIFPGFHERDVININYSQNNKIYNIIIHCKIDYGKYIRNEYDLIYKINIPFIKSIIGNIDDIILPNGEKIKMNSSSFNEVIQNKKHYLTNYKGLPIYDRNRKQIVDYGKLYIEYNINYPKINTNILKSEKEILEKEFSKILEI